jgi:hypothetical protein
MSPCIRTAAYWILAAVVLPLSQVSCDQLSEDHADQACPPSPSKGFVDFLPIESGEIWTFDYGYSHHVTGIPDVREEGTLMLSLGESTCLNGTRRVYAEERTIADHYVRDVGEWELRSQIDRTQEIIVVETEEGVSFPWWDVVDAPRYHRAGLDSVVVVQPLDCYGNSNVTTILKPGALVHFSYDCDVSHADYHFVLNRKK